MQLRARPPFPLGGYSSRSHSASNELEIASMTEMDLCGSGQRDVISVPAAGKFPQKEGHAIPEPKVNQMIRSSHRRISPLISLHTTTMESSPVIPPELLGAIVAYVQSPSDLRQLRAANTTLNTFATPRAFRSICLVNRDNRIRDFKLLASSELAPHVREIIFQYMEADPGAFVQDRPVHLSRLILDVRTQTGKADLYPIMHREDLTEQLLWEHLPTLYIFLAWSHWSSASGRTMALSSLTPRAMPLVGNILANLSSSSLSSRLWRKYPLVYFRL
jgi:hypothetical protein